MGFRITFGESSGFHATFGESGSFGATFSEYRGGGIPWRGEYESTPSWNEQVYGTRGYTMGRDFTVHSIVKQEAPNQAGGLTLSI